MKNIFLFGSLVVFSLASLCMGTDQDIKYTVTGEVWLKVAIKDSVDSPNSSAVILGTIDIGLFGDIVPMTTTNFGQLAKGFKRGNKYLGYKNSPFHRVVRDFVIQSGDITNRDGTGSECIYGDKFIDENFILSHRSAGWVSMANYGEDTNGSQFFITLVPSRWLDGHHVVFGRVLSGMNIVREIADTPTYKASSTTKKYIYIADSGLRETNRYDLSEEQIDSPGDINQSE